jgi:hypothetical protein
VKSGKVYYDRKNDSFSNNEERVKFRENIQAKRKSKLKILVYSIEGDPIIYTFKYRNSKLIQVTDCRRDAYRAKFLRHWNFNPLLLSGIFRTVVVADSISTYPKLRKYLID